MSETERNHSALLSVRRNVGARNVILVSRTAQQQANANRPAETGDYSAYGIRRHLR
jgi:hypothetical protein